LPIVDRRLPIELTIGVGRLDRGLAIADRVAGLLIAD
jgi:hypothetical protein